MNGICLDISAGFLMYNSITEARKIKRNLLVALAFLIGCLGIIVVVSAGEEAQRRQMETRRDGQVRDSIVLIATSLRRYKAMFNEYPDYLWGGSSASWQKAVVAGVAPDIHDPLIREGIWSHYPRNPWIADGRSICDQTNEDPRFGCIAGEGGGLTMGNTLSDYRNVRSLMPKGAQTNRYYLFTNEHSSKVWNWIPGDFGYRRIDPEHYVLFAYGSPHRPGLDLLNNEYEEKERSPHFEGPPDALFRFNIEKNGTAETLIGNPDGVPDGIILVVTEAGTFQQTR